MKKIFILAVFAFLVSAPLMAQYSPCYNDAYAEGQDCFRKGNYKKALKLFKEAKACPDSNVAAADEMINKCSLKIEEQEKRKDRERREEAERLAREAEEKRLRAEETSMAKNGYMSIDRVRFINVNYNYRREITVVSEGQLYDEELRYVMPVVCYKGLDTKTDTVALYVKLFDKNHNLLVNQSSPEGYTYYCLSIVNPGDDQELQLKPWGNGTNNYYTQGEYHFELYCNENRLYSTYFNVNKALPKDFPVCISVGSDAEIFLNGVSRGKNTWRGRLVPGQYEVVCKKAGYRDSEKKIITVTESTQEQPFYVDPPQPIYVSFEVKSDPKRAKLVFDGIERGTTPITLSKVMVGDHTLMLDKKGYRSYSKTISVTEGMGDLNITMDKPRRRRSFGVFFLDFVAGDFKSDDLMIGGHAAICPRRVGCYVQYLHGMESSSSRTTGGLVFRLTRDYVDFQLYTGAGYGRFSSSQSDVNKSFLMDFGGRLSWRSRSGWAMWDLMGGCYVTPKGNVYPYAGIGTGFSLIGAVTMLTLWASGVL